MRVAGELQRVRQDDEIETRGGERQRVEMAAQRRRRDDGDARGLRRALDRDVVHGDRVDGADIFVVAGGLDREPTVRHAVGLQRGELRQPELQRMKAEHVGDGAVEMALFPLEQDLSHGGT